VALAGCVNEPENCPRAPSTTSAAENLPAVLLRQLTLETNVEMYPASGRAADALGTGYEMDHNVHLAIRAYQTAVKLDPTLSHASDRLKQLKQ
jgi:cytochrome c-type biogenesis protein CcmH/NrfG